MGTHSLLQGIFPTQGSNPSLLHCRQILYQLSHKESPRILEWIAYSFSRGSSGPRNRTKISCTAGGFFTSWATREAQAPGHEYQQNKETEAQETEINQGDRVAGEREGVPGWLPQRRSRFRGLSITGQRPSHPAVSCPWAGELLGQVAGNSPFHVYKKYSTTVLCHNI